MAASRSIGSEAATSGRLSVDVAVSVPRRIPACSSVEICALLLGAAAILGCSSAVAPEQRAHAQASLDEALEARQSGDLQRANERFRQAIEAGVLNADQFCTANLELALVEADLDNAAAAHAALDAIADGAAEMDKVHAARAYVLDKQGKSAEAREQERLAKQINPAVRLFRPGR